MAKFTTNTRRIDPYRNFKFRRLLGFALAGAAAAAIVTRLLKRSEGSEED
jgi:hypothetical protein